MADTHQNESAYTLTNSDLAILPFIDFDEGLFLFPGNEHTKAFGVGPLLLKLRGETSLHVGTTRVVGLCLRGPTSEHERHQWLPREKLSTPPAFVSSR